MSNYDFERARWKKLYNEGYTLCDNKVAELYENTFLKERYDEFVTNIAGLITTICEGDTNFYKVFSIYYCLLWNGYFSVNNNFVFDHYDSNINCCRGASIMCGKGVCLNISALMSDVLKKMDVDFNGCVVGVKLHKEDGWKFHHGAVYKQYGESFMRSSGDSDETEDEDEQLINHADVLIINDEGIYMLDPTNFLIYKLIHQNSSDLLIEENIVEARFSVDGLADSELRRKRLSQMDFVNEYLSRCIPQRLDEEFLREHLEDGVISCRKHLQDIKSFFSSNYDNIQMISEQVPPIAARLKKRHKEFKKTYGVSE